MARGWRCCGAVLAPAAKAIRGGAGRNGPGKPPQPGLAQLLSAQPWYVPPALNDTEDDGSLAVLPATRLALRRADGLDQTGALQRLQPLLRAYAVVLYAPPVAIGTAAAAAPACPWS